MSSDAAPTKRVSQVVLVVCTLGTSWLGMQAVHELGHLVGAWMSQATVERVVLHPLTISRMMSDITHSHFWLSGLDQSWVRDSVHSVAGQLLGKLVQCVSAALLRRVLPRGQWLLHRSRIIGSCRGLRRDASVRQSTLDAVVVGSTMAPAGLWLWNGQSPYFGWGGDLGKIDPRAVRVSVIAFVSLIVLGLLIGNRKQTHPGEPVRKPIPIKLSYRSCFHQERHQGKRSATRCLDNSFPS